MRILHVRSSGGFYGAEALVATLAVEQARIEQQFHYLGNAASLMKGGYKALVKLRDEKVIKAIGAGITMATSVNEWSAVMLEVLRERQARMVSVARLTSMPCAASSFARRSAVDWSCCGGIT